MDVDFDKNTRHLTVGIGSIEAEHIANGGVIKSTDTHPSVSVRPLSEINPDSRKIEPDDTIRTRRAMGQLVCEVTEIKGHVTIHVPEALLQSTDIIAAEHIDHADIISEKSKDSVHSVRVEFT